MLDISLNIKKDYHLALFWKLKGLIKQHKYEEVLTILNETNLAETYYQMGEGFYKLKK